MGQVRGRINGGFRGKVHLKQIRGGLKTMICGDRRVISYREPKKMELGY